jgi:hypothetical protein
MAQPGIAEPAQYRLPKLDFLKPFDDDRAAD